MYKFLKNISLLGKYSLGIYSSNHISSDGSSLGEPLSASRMFFCFFAEEGWTPRPLPFLNIIWQFFLGNKHQIYTKRQHPPSRAVDMRAGEVNNKYIRKARNTDLQYCGTEPGTTGPVETKLGSSGEVKGVVVGVFGEGSEDLQSLIHHLAISRVRVAGPPEREEGAGAD